ncbi:MAG: hypothetical protein JWP57_4521 [Spirosoma sp.]|nr:hypothetical protein [Spirosoma sp.]
MMDHPAPGAWEPYSPAALTILRASNGRRLAKRFARGADGRVFREDFGNAFLYQTTHVLPNGIHGMFNFLRELETETDICVIRGAQTPWCDDTATRRCKAAFAEVPRSYALLDIDGVDIAPGLHMASDPTGAAHTFCARLDAFVPELAGVTMAVKWSSSAGIMEMAEHDERWAAVAKPGVSAHVWFYVRTSLGEAELVRWVRAVNQRAGLRLLDEAACRTVQPLYTSAPIFADGLADPLSGMRTVLVHGDRNEAELDVPLPDAPCLRSGAQSRAAASRSFGDGGVLHDSSGWVIDGRDAHLSRNAFRAVREAEETGIDPYSHEAAVIDRAWEEFRRTTDLSRPKRDGWPYGCQDAAEKVRQKLSALRSGTLPAATRRSVVGSLALLKALRGRR